MADVATVLVDVIEDRKLFARISGHEHITAEGWTTLGGMLGIVPRRRLDEAERDRRRLRRPGRGAHPRRPRRRRRRVASARAPSADGRPPSRTRSAAWRRRGRSARALRAPLGQIVVLAGYEPAGRGDAGDRASRRSRSTSNRPRPTLIPRQYRRPRSRQQSYAESSPSSPSSGPLLLARPRPGHRQSAGRRGWTCAGAVICSRSSSAARGSGERLGDGS